jgi:hypothetical protein
VQEWKFKVLIVNQQLQKMRLILSQGLDDLTLSDIPPLGVKSSSPYIKDIF